MIKTEYAVLTNAGGRGINEDTVLAIPSSLGLVVTVADGLGGHGGGSTASRAAAAAVSDCFGIFGAAVSRMRGPTKGRSRRWEPQEENCFGRALSLMKIIRKGRYI